MRREELANRRDEFRAEARTTRSAVGSLVNHHEPHVGPHSFQLIEVREVSIQASHDRDRWHLYRRDLRRGD